MLEGIKLLLTGFCWEGLDDLLQGMARSLDFFGLEGGELS